MNPIAAHRGWSGIAPENTMAAFTLAFDEPRVAWIELDVQLSKDGIPIVIHDFTLKRTTNGSGRVRDLTYAQLSELDAGSWFDRKFKGEKIPALSDVLQAARGRCRLNIELKTAGDMYPGLEEKVCQLVAKHQMRQEVVITSFDHAAIQRAKRIDPQIQTGLIISGMPLMLQDQMHEAGARLLSMDYHFLTKPFVEAAFNLGYSVMAWTVNDPASIAAMASMHHDLMICTNFPDRAIKVVHG